jgi:glycosyltransferase involved in cell wall biosynthesis
MDPDMARGGWRDLQTMARLEESSARIAGKARDRLAVGALEMSWYMRNQLLVDADWAGMAHSVEIRVPLVDIPLLKAAAPWIAGHATISKQKVAHAAAPGLPAHLLRRPKSGFQVPVREWLGAPSASTRGLRGWARYVHDWREGQRPPRVMISTLAPGHGGVSAMTNFVVNTLAARGMEPVIAYYAPYSVMPELSVPSFKLFQRRAGYRQGLAYGSCEAHAIGAWLPELEFTHYAATTRWREVMDSCDAFVSASGNVLAASPYCQTGRPYLAWVASDWDGDRHDRVKHFPLVRRLLDACVNGPIIRKLQRKLLAGGHVLSLSDYTARTLGTLIGPSFRKAVLPVPIDTELFVPKPGARVPGRVGFAGRFRDPRKNIGLLLQTVAHLRSRGHDVTAVLMGDSSFPALERQVAALGLDGHVSVKAYLSREDMRDCLQTLDVFILPSHQEGLCIAALEAMACGVPVVSTHCGGPEEFVIPDVTGYLVEAQPQEMARAVAGIISEPDLRSRLSASARQLVEQHYAKAPVEAAFAEALKECFHQLGGQRAPAELKLTTVVANESVG